MKGFISGTILASISLALAFGMSTSAEARKTWKDQVQFQKDGMKAYSKNCINHGAYCGNWNVKS